MDYLLKRSDRKTISLEITRDLAVLVRAPRFMAQRDVDRFVAQHAGWIADHLEKQRQRQAAQPAPELGADELSELKRRAAEALPGRVAHYAALMGLSPTGITITSAKTRFGSCSGKNRLCFSCRLMLYPPAAVDYVVVHELAHIRHKNHGSAFYACIASVLPDYKERRKLLRPQ